MKKLQPLTGKEKAARIIGGIVVILFLPRIAVAIGGIVGASITSLAVVVGLALIGNAVFAPKKTLER